MTTEVAPSLRVRCSDRLTVEESSWRQLRVPVRPHTTAYLRAIAGSGMECSFRYFLAERSDGQVVAATYGFVMRVPLTRYVALPLFATGSPVNLGVPFHFRCPEVVGAALPKLVSAIVAEAKTMGAKCLVVRDLWSPEPDQTYGPVLSALGLRRTPFFTDAVLPVSQDLETYLASLPSKTRKALRRDERRVRNAGYHFTVVRDPIPEPLLADMQRLWRNLYDKYRDRDQVYLPIGYFQAVTALPESIALLAFHGRRLVGFDLLLEHDKVLESTYSGIDGDHVGGRPVHRYMGHQIVRLAIESGFREVDFGTSNEAAKAKMGCRIRQGWAYVLPLSRVFGALRIDRLLFSNRKGFGYDTERFAV